MEASNLRNIKSGLEYDHLFPKVNGNEITTKSNANVEDTLRLIKKIVRNTLSDTMQVAYLLKSQDVYNTCSAIWHFVYEHIQYKKDKKGSEQVRRPARTWSDRKAGVDCDCYSVFISSILLNLGIPHKLRIAKYNGKTYFQHIYVIVPTNEGEHITLDCVKDQFNTEEDYSDKKDYNMDLTYLDGLSGIEGPVSVDLLDIQTSGFGMLDYNGWESIEGLGYIQREKAEAALQHQYGYVPEVWNEEDYEYIEGLGFLKRFGNWVKTKAAPTVGKVVGTAVTVGSGLVTGGPSGALQALQAAKQRKEELQSNQEAQKAAAEAAKAAQAEAELRRVEEESRRAEQERTMQQMKQMQNTMLTTMQSAVSKVAPAAVASPATPALVTENNNTAIMASQMAPPPAEEKGMMAWIKKNPIPTGVIALAVIGGGVYMATRNSKSSQRGKSMDGLPRKSKRRKPLKRKAKKVIF